MSFSRRALVQASLALTSLGAWAASPTGKPVTLVVTYPPGGQNDLAGRIVARRLGEAWGQPVIVDNRPGASGAIGAQTVARAAPDGNTLLLMAVNHVLLPSLNPATPFSATRDFTPVGLVAAFPFVLIVNPSVPAQSVKEFVALAAKTPNAVTFGSSGNGGGEHLAGELFAAQAGVKMLHVPYKGSAPAINDLLGGQIQAMFCAAPAAVQHIKSGKVRALGVSTATRASMLPDIPTIAEAGLPGYEAFSWVGVVAPAKTPAAIVAATDEALQKSLSDPEVKAQLQALGGEPRGGSARAFEAFIAQEQRKWDAIIRDRGIRLE